MTTNQQRAFECWADSDPVAAIAAALDAAEARGRAEVERIADERAADLLDELGDYEDRMGSTLAAGRLYDRAASLRPASREETGL